MLLVLYMLGLSCCTSTGDSAVCAGGAGTPQSSAHSQVQSGQVRSGTSQSSALTVVQSDQIRPRTPHSSAHYRAVRSNKVNSGKVRQDPGIGQIR